jgi:hypothetical protein
MMKPKALTNKEILAEIIERPVVPLWPHVGKTLGLSRGGTYAAAERGDIKTIRLGRLKRVPTAWLRQTLGLDGPAP